MSDNEDRVIDQTRVVADRGEGLRCAIPKAWLFVNLHCPCCDEPLPTPGSGFGTIAWGVDLLDQTTFVRCPKCNTESRVCAQKARAAIRRAAEV